MSSAENKDAKKLSYLEQSSLDRVSKVMHEVRANHAHNDELHTIQAERAWTYFSKLQGQGFDREEALAIVLAREGRA